MPEPGPMNPSGPDDLPLDEHPTGPEAHRVNPKRGEGM